MSVQITEGREQGKETKVASLKMVFVTQDEPFYLPAFFETVLGALGSEVQGIVILKPRLGKKRSFRQTLSKHLDLYGWKDFLALSTQFAMCGALARIKPALPIRKNFSVGNVAHQFGIPVLCPAEVNSEESLNWIGGHDPDLVVSISAPQIFRSRLLDLPRLGCINLHGGALPHYQGMMPSFWVLANGERETAVTVHRMTVKIDDGDILCQRPVPVYPNDSLDALIRRSKAAGAQAVLEVVERFRRGTVEGLPLDKSQATYYSFPTRADRARFLEAGHRFR